MIARQSLKGKPLQMRSGSPKKRLGELIHIKHGYAFRGEYFSDFGPFVVLTPGNFYDEGGFKDKGDKEKHYVGEVPKDFILKKGDLLVAMTEQAEGLLGSAAIVPSSNNYLHNQRLGLVTEIDKAEIDRRYLYYLFNTKHVRQQIRASASGTKVRHTSPSRIYEVAVSAPCLAIQRTVAEILSAYDYLIENNTRRIKILEEMAQSLYREWFVHFRFPGHEKTKLVDSPLGKIPKKWEIKELSEIADINASSIKRGNEPKEIDYVDISSVVVGRIENIKRYALADAPGRARRIVKHGDIIWSCVRPNRKSYALMLKPNANLIVSTGFAVVSPKRAPHTYLYQALTTDEFIGYLTNRARGAAYPAVTSEDFEDARLLFPPGELLDRFDRTVSSHFELVNILHQKNTNLRRTRDLLLPKLISGEVEVR